MTATPPITTKSTSSRASLPNSAAISGSGGIVAGSRHGGLQGAQLRVPPRDALVPRLRRARQCLAEEADVDAVAPRRRDELEPMARGPQDAVEGLDRGVGALALELGDRRLADAQAGRELGLGEACRAASVADEE